MSFSVSDAELRRMVDLVRPTSEQASPGESFDHGLLSRLAVAFDCVDVTFQVSEPGREIMIGVVEGLQDGSTVASAGLDADEAPEFWKNHWEREFCCYPERTGDYESVVMASDFETDRESRRLSTGPCQDFACLMVPLPLAGPRDRRLFFWRSQNDPFGERDRLLLTLLRPHFAQVLEAHDRAGQNPPVLTPRERELVTLLAGGLTNRQIGRELGIAEGTVRKHLEHVYARLGVTNRVAVLAVYRDLQPNPTGPLQLAELAHAL